MKILILNDYGTLSGGAEHVSVLLRDGLRARGYDARLFSSSARPLPVENAADYTCFGKTGRAGKLLAAANPWAALKLRSVLSTFQPDIVHVRLFQTQISPLILPLLENQRALFHVGSYYAICPIGTKQLPNGTPCHHPPGIVCLSAGCVAPLAFGPAMLGNALWRNRQRVFDVVIAASEWAAERLRAEGIEVSEAIWNGVPVRPARPPLEPQPSVAYAGRLFPKKGVSVLVHAMAMVLRRLPQSRLLIAGDGPERRSIEQLIEQLGIGRQVRLLGHRPRDALEQDLASAWVQAVPSIWEEPFGIVAAEAMMRGTAVVVSNTGGLGEYVTHEVNGLKVAPDDPQALAEALLRLLENRTLAERWGGAGRSFALAKLSEGRFLDRFGVLYERLLRER